MPDENFLAAEFEAKRAHLQAVAYRMLGSRAEADDAVQETWLRLHRADTNDVENLGGWLTTVVARVCLDMLRSRKSRIEDSVGAHVPDALVPSIDARDQESALADSIGPALLVVLETLAPAERIAFVLHDMFAVSFEEIARVLDRTEPATRQLASRARRRVQGGASPSEQDGIRERAIVEAFLAASKGGDFTALLAVLAPDVVMRADAIAQKLGAEPELRGADPVARRLMGRAGGARLAFVNGVVAAVWAPGGKTRVAFRFAYDGERLVAIDLIGDRPFIEESTIEIVDA